MASIFTFDPDPPRVSSPWATPPAGSSTPQQPTQPSHTKPTTSLVATDTADVDYASITKLEAEPQEGPTEYKLHLLLRQRRAYSHVSIRNCVPGNQQGIDTPLPVTLNGSASAPSVTATAPPSLATTQTRNHRLEQLTTQLLWRLQQSCPYHISSTTAAVLPFLPDDAQLCAPDLPQKLLPGLEESKGALYEIGVADDGTLVGLAEDEMFESLNNLRAMAACLGCGVEVLRWVLVGTCEWLDNSKTPQQITRTSKLVVAEAIVRPLQHLVEHTKSSPAETSDAPAQLDDGIPSMASPHTSIPKAEQLRISVTGATKSGKSSLLGTLSTATLDNGRGSSRLSLLKHRHEIASGMTSSVTQELIGYRDVTDQNAQTVSRVIGYGSGNVSSWIDIHSSVEDADSGRLVVLSDSAGHLRFRRTTVRGIVGWQPHWTLLCIPAEDVDDSTGDIAASPVSKEQQVLAATEPELSPPHLQLCLNLELPLVIVITKYDLAKLGTLRQTLSRLLTALKEAGRKPHIIKDPAASALDTELRFISATDLHEADEIVKSLAASPLAAVPIILTSAVNGTGITKLHAFLRKLPIPPHPNKSLRSSPSSPSSLFYIEDIYSVQANASSNRSAIIGGYLRFGNLNVGDEFLLGPYPGDTSSDDSDSGSGRRPSRTQIGPQSRSFPGAFKNSHGNNLATLDRHAEWRRVRITSLRNLRVPVSTLRADQVGTMCIAPVDTPILSPAINRIRKGMVLANPQPKASKVITVRFEGAQAIDAQNLSIGSAVEVYIASVRASSKVMSVVTETGAAGEDSNDKDEDDSAFGFGFDDDVKEESGSPTPSATRITFQFGAREFVEIGAKVLVLPGGGPGLSSGNEKGAKGHAGLDGFVGRVVEE